jgi:broad specificity phosphatase PhoE
MCGASSTSTRPRNVAAVMGQILLVRHAQASFGSADYDRLSDLGREQAQLLGAWIACRGRRIDLAVSGRLKRHRDTAEACCAALPAALKPPLASRPDAGFDEYDADEIVARERPDLAHPATLQRYLAEGDHPGRAFYDLFGAAMRRWMQGAHDAEYRESWKSFGDRCMAALNRLVSDAGPSRTSIVFTSGGPIAAICQNLLELPDHRALDLNLSLANGAVTALLYQPGRVSVSYLNNFAFLEQTGNARLITYR